MLVSCRVIGKEDDDGYKGREEEFFSGWRTEG